MSKAVICSLRHESLKFARWSILLFPLCFAGCFESQAAKDQRYKPRAGMAAFGHYFSFSDNSQSAQPSEGILNSEIPDSIEEDFAGISGLPEDLEDIDIALPDFVGNGQIAADTPLTGIFQESPFARGLHEAKSSYTGNASIFGKSFNQFFSSVFSHNKIDAGSSNSVEQEEDINPFTEARQKLENSSASSETKTESTDKTAEDTESKKGETKEDAAKGSESKAADSADNSKTASAGGLPADQHFLIVGDLTGSGILSSVSARRTGDTEFVSKDGERKFNLYINSRAVEEQRAFYMDDLNGDGHSDLVITEYASLFGAVLIGDEHGLYTYLDKFVTGYEPRIPSAGPIRNGMREILTISPITGNFDTYLWKDHYRRIQSEDLSILPKYVMHLVSPDTDQEFVMAGSPGVPEQILGWGDDDLLRATNKSLGEDATVLTGSFDTNTVQAYQVGNYASVVLTSSKNKSFNVANFRVMPGTYLVIGDLRNRGDLDVAVGKLTSFNKH